MAVDLPDWILGINIEMQTLPTVAIDIAAQTLGTVAIDIAAQTLGTVAIDIAAQSLATLAVDIVAASIGVVSVDIAAQSVGNIAIDIAAQTLGTVAVDITAQSLGNVAIDIAAQTVGNLAVDLVAQTVGNLAIDIAAQTLGNVAITIAASTVQLNIKTLGGTNIIIDQLTQAAFTARVASIQNHGAATNWAAYTGVNRAGKFFPRGCRGHLNIVDVRCRDVGAAGGIITVYVAPYIGAGYLYTANIVVPPGGAEAWRTAAFNVMWEYDSLFIWILSSDANMQIAWDITSPGDWWGSANSGVTWTYIARRPHFYAVLFGETVGDIPVSGTLNVIEIPYTTPALVSGTYTTVNGVEQTLATVNGIGKLVHLLMITNPAAESHLYSWRLVVDGATVFIYQPDWIKAVGFTASTPGISLLSYTANGQTSIQVVLPYGFSRSLVLMGQRAAAGANVLVVWIINVSLMR